MQILLLAFPLVQAHNILEFSRLLSTQSILLAKGAGLADQCLIPCFPLLVNAAGVPAAGIAEQLPGTVDSLLSDLDTTRLWKPAGCC
ncbi:hypothetical protein HYALB_00012461 [Hymenoscyphus albidus]|uniref:Uncharacterized protein n=1 Tax=Hymenoscyphus albidus TaxID=595503 RepID=A0A9N9LNH0_9HELO|nr:hypothetical protein HYALB_00012461 [Hymenoscyphus albidus]